MASGLRYGLFRCLLLLAGLGAGLPVFLAVLAFLVSDACLDAGGAVVDPMFACLLHGGQQLPWLALVRPGMVASALVFAALFVLLICGALRCCSPKRRRGGD